MPSRPDRERCHGDQRSPAGPGAQGRRCSSVASRHRPRADRQWTDVWVRSTVTVLTSAPPNAWVAGREVRTVTSPGELGLRQPSVRTGNTDPPRPGSERLRSPPFPLLPHSRVLGLRLHFRSVQPGHRGAPGPATLTAPARQTRLPWRDWRPVHWRRTRS